MFFGLPLPLTGWTGDSLPCSAGMVIMMMRTSLSASFWTGLWQSVQACNAKDQSASPTCTVWRNTAVPFVLAICKRLLVVLASCSQGSLPTFAVAMKHRCKI